MSIFIGNRPGTLAESKEVSGLLGAKKPYAEDIDPENGCFNIQASRDTRGELVRDGYIERTFTLASGANAVFNAEMP